MQISKGKSRKKKVTVAALPKNTNTPLPGGTPIQQSQLTSIRWTRRAAAKASPNSRPCLFQRNECRAKKGGQSSSGICQTEPEKRDARGSGERCLGAVNTAPRAISMMVAKNRLATSATPIQNFAGLDRIFCASAPSHKLNLAPRGRAAGRATRLTYPGRACSPVPDSNFGAGKTARDAAISGVEPRVPRKCYCAPMRMTAGRSGNRSAGRMNPVHNARCDTAMHDPTKNSLSEEWSNAARPVVPLIHSVIRRRQCHAK